MDDLSLILIVFLLCNLDCSLACEKAENGVVVQGLQTGCYYNETYGSDFIFFFSWESARDLDFDFSIFDF